MVEISQEKLSEIGPDERSNFPAGDVEFSGRNGVEFWANEAIEIFGQTQNKRIDCSRRVIKALRINSNQSNN